MDFADFAEFALETARKHCCQGSLTPLAFALLHDGSLVPMLAAEGGQEGVDLLMMGLRTHLEAGELAAGAVVYDVYARRPDTGETCDAIVAHFEAEDVAIRALQAYRESSTEIVFEPPHYERVAPQLFV